MGRVSQHLRRHVRRHRRFGVLEALSCLEAGDLKKSQVPIGQQKPLLLCVSKQLATSDTDDSTRDEMASQQPAPIEAPPAPVENAAPSTSAGAVDGRWQRLRRRLSEEAARAVVG